MKKIYISLLCAAAISISAPIHVNAQQQQNAEKYLSTLDDVDQVDLPQADWQNNSHRNVYILVDKSSSVGNKKTREYIERILAAFADDVPLSNNGVRISLSIFADTFALIVPLTADKKLLYEGISSIAAENNDTSASYMCAGISFIDDLISYESQDDSLSLSDIVIISDGLATDQMCAKLYAQGMLDNTTTIRISSILAAVGCESAPDFMRDLASDPKRYFGNDYSLFVKEMAQLGAQQ